MKQPYSMHVRKQQNSPPPAPPYPRTNKSRKPEQGKCHACAATAPAATAAAAGEAATGLRIPQNLQHDPGGTTTSQSLRTPPAGTASTPPSAAEGKAAANEAGAGRAIAPRGTVGGRDLRGRARGSAAPVVEYPSDASVRRDPQRAFGFFRERHPGRAALEENKKLLGEKYARAKVTDSVSEHVSALPRSHPSRVVYILLRLRSQVSLCRQCARKDVP